MMKKHLKDFFIFLSIFWLYTFICHYPNVNEISRFGLTWSIVDRGVLNIDPVAEFTVDKAYHSGHFYTDKAPGLSFLAVPVYFMYESFLEPSLIAWLRTGMQSDDAEAGIAIDRLSHQLKLWASRAFTVSIISAIFAVLFINYLESISGINGRILGYCYALGTMAYCYSTVFYAHQLVAVFLFGAFYLVREKNASSRLLADFVPGFLIGLSFLLELPSVLIGSLIGLYYVWRIFVETPKKYTRTQFMRLSIFFLAAFLPVAALALYNQACFGGVLKSGYSNLLEGSYFKKEMAKGFFGIGIPSLNAMWGMTFGLERGIFILSPFLILVIPALLLKLNEWRKARFENMDSGFLVSTLAVLVYFFFNSSYHFWDGGDAIGPRHFIPALPFAVFLCASLGKKWTLPISALGLLSIVFASVATVTDPQSLKKYPLWVDSWPMFLNARTSIMPLHFLGFRDFFPMLFYFAVPLCMIVITLFIFLRAKSDAENTAG